MTLKLLRLILLFCCGTLAISCNTSHATKNLKEGDLLFQNLNCGDLCDAIETVTQGVDGKSFSHCAVVVNIHDTLKVVEAIGKKVQVNSLRNFFARSGDTANIENVTVGRVKSNYENLLPKASLNAQKLVGQPYDDVFLLNNGSWYCSELLYEVFKEANDEKDFFVLAPMTFKDPKTKAFFPAWQTYYKDLGKEIPEGQAGINPGLISRSNKIEIIAINHY